jgi:deoxyhypusine synthase
MDIATYAILNKKIKNVEKDILSNNSLHLTRKIVDKVPSAAEADEHTIYLLKKENVTGEDKYEEYMLIDGTIQKIGDTSVDLSNYATIEKLNEEL